MWKSSVVVLSSLVLLSLVVSAIPWADAARPSAHLSSEEKALVEHLDGEYGMDLASRLSSFPFSYGGEVVPGSSEDLQVAKYLANEMEVLGLDDVTIDSFTLVNWNYKLASLEITSPTVEVPSIDTRSMANSPSTPAGGVEGLLVDVGLGRNIDYDAVGSVGGKLVLIERNDLVMWYTTPAVCEAGYRGAIGALVWNPYRSPEALNVDTMHNSIPTLSIRAVDAMYLKELLAAGPVRLKIEVQNVINENAQAHAVYGYIWGSKYPDEYIVLEGHYDHWWNGANDNNGGVASSLAIAKAIKDAGIVPKRTLVFMALSGHESGTGGSKESFWDWGLGGYYFMNVIHPEWSKKIVWMSASDGGGVKASWMYVETTPELAGFLKQVVLDVGAKSLMTPYVFTPVSSFDSWGFYMAGVPASTFYCGAPLTASYEEYYYHTDLEGMFLLDPVYLKMDAAFRGVAGLRISQSEVLPYNFEGTVKEMEKTLEKLTDAVPDADVSALTASVNAFERKVGTLNDYVKGLKNPAPETVKEINSKLIKVVNTVNPLLWDQDIGYYYPYPGWCSVTKFDTFMNDMSCLEGAVKALNMEDNVGALKSLAKVVTMSWGQYVSYPVYLDVVWLFNGTPYLNWATGHLPWLTNVHQDYTAIASGVFDYQAEIANLSAKLGVLFDKLDLTAASVKLAFDNGTAILATI